MSAARTIIFDLDGTLIDSAAGILRSLNIAFQKQGMTVCATEEFVIGRRLTEIIKSLAPNLTHNQTAEIAEDYRKHYDEEGWKSAFPYAGVIEMLCSHYDQGKTLYLCTNKPTRPTHSILVTFGMLNFFRRFICSDTLTRSQTSPYAPYEVDKATMLRELLEEHQPNPNAVYVGDTAEDAVAAHEIGIPFVWASYGYGKTAKSPAYLSDL